MRSNIFIENFPLSINDIIWRGKRKKIKKKRKNYLNYLTITWGANFDYDTMRICLYEKKCFCKIRKLKDLCLVLMWSIFWCHFFVLGDDIVLTYIENIERLKSRFHEEFNSRLNDPDKSKSRFYEEFYLVIEIS